jgi:hypothetical protein
MADRVMSARRPGDFIVEVFADPRPGFEVCWEVFTAVGFLPNHPRSAGVGGWEATEDAAIAQAKRHGGKRRVSS